MKELDSVGSARLVFSQLSQSHIWTHEQGKAMNIAEDYIVELVRNLEGTRTSQVLRLNELEKIRQSYGKQLEEQAELVTELRTRIQDLEDSL